MSAPTSLSAWAFDQAEARGFTPSVRLTLLALAKLINGTSPTLRNLVRGTGLSRRSVIDAISTVETAGLVEATRQPGHPTIYRLLLPQGGAVSTAERCSLNRKVVQYQPEGGAIPSRAGAVEFLPSSLSTPKKEPSHPTLSPLFEQFYRHYPRKVARIEAEKAFGQMVAKGHDPQAIIEGVKRYPFDTKEDCKYVKYPASWLRSGCWMDERPKRPTAPEDRPSLFVDDGSEELQPFAWMEAGE